MKAREPPRSTRRSHPAPIERIPTELLAKVFLYYGAATYEYLDPKAAGASQDTVFCVMQVCRHWREVALAAPELWSTFSVVGGGPSTFLDTMLRRSKNHPLTVKMLLHGFWEFNESSCLKIFGQFARIRHLYFDDFLSGLTLIQDLVPQRAPLLKSLTLDVSDYGGSGVATTITKFEHCELPSLRSLALLPCVVSWSSPLFRLSLSSLRLINHTSNDRGSYSDVFNALQAMPLLEHLELCEVLPTASHNEDWSIDQSVQLPHLREIYIEDNVRSCAQLFQSLVFPASTIINICTSGWRTDLASQCQALLKNLANNLEVKDATIATTPFLGAYASWAFNTYGVYQGLVLKCYRSPCSLDISRKFELTINPDNLGDKPALFVQLPGYDTENSALEPVETILRTLPLSEVECLALDGPHATSLSKISQPTTEMWTDCFRSMTKLRQLAVKGWGVQMLPEPLALCVETSAQVLCQDSTATDVPVPSREPMLFPLLGTFTVILVPAFEVDPEQLLPFYHGAFKVRNTPETPLQECMTKHKLTKGETRRVAPYGGKGAFQIQYSWFKHDDTIGPVTVHRPISTGEEREKIDIWNPNTWIGEFDTV